MGKPKRRRPPRPKGLLRRISRAAKKHGAALFLAAIGVATSFTVYYLAYSEPDIRPLRDTPMRSYVTPSTVRPDGSCVYGVSVLQKFKNFSIKSGHIDRATVTSWSPDALTGYELIEIDRDQLRWRGEKEIQLRFNVTLDSTSVAKLENRKEPLEFEMRFYDNTGKLLNTADDNHPIYFYANVTSSTVRSTYSQNQNQ